MKKLIIMATLAAAAGCSADITPEDVKVADYKDGKECAVSLTFDDSMKEHYTIVAPELEKRGFRGTFWMVGSWMPAVAEADTTHFTWAEAKEMSDRGHEMSNHTWSHPYLTMLSDEELLNEIKKNDEAILANIGKPSTTFCFPYNAFNDKVIAAAMEGRIGARLKEFWLGGQHSPKEYLQKQVEDALASGSWIAGMTHGINYGYDCYTDPTEFTDFLDYLKSLESRIWVGTFRDVAAYTAVAKDVNSAKGRVRLMTTFFRVSTPSREINCLLRHSMPIMSITNTGRAVSKTEITISIAYLITPFCRMMLA